MTPAEQLMVVVPRDTDLEVEANLANRDVGFVHKGQNAAIKIEAFTFTRYGLLHGTVVSLSQDAVASQVADNANDQEQVDRAGEGSKENDESQIHQPSYVAHIALKERGVKTEQGFMPLEPGMAVTAEIKTASRSVISYLLSQLVRYQHEGLRER